LVSQGHDVICLDNFYTGSKSNVAHLLGHSNFELLRHDVTIPLYVEVDQIYNLACPASPVHYQSDPVRTIETNFLGIINLLHLAKKTGAKILQASTSEVYGDPLISPQSETYWGNVNPVGIRSCYDEGKRAAETLCFDYKRQFGVDARVIRIFNTYGPRMAIGDGRVVSNFIVQALSGNDITLYGDGSQTRSFCYVSDLVEGIYSYMIKKTAIESPVNLGNPTEFNMLELAEKILNITKSNSKLLFMPLPLDDPRQRKPDISLAKNELGWNPEISLSAGLSKTIEYFRRILN
jgi:UDP-glucuronate decarboxylase